MILAGIISSLHAPMRPQRERYISSIFETVDVNATVAGSGKQSSGGEDRCVHQQVGVRETRKACSRTVSTSARAL